MEHIKEFNPYWKTLTKLKKPIGWDTSVYSPEYSGKIKPQSYYKPISKLEI